MVGAQQAKRAHLPEDRRVGLFIAEGLQHAGRELLLAIRTRCVAHLALLVAQLMVQK